MIPNFKAFKTKLMKVDTFLSVADTIEKANMAAQLQPGTKITQKIEQKTTLQRNIEKVVSVDEKVIELVLKSEITKVEPSAGFLIEVFASGSDGILTRLFSEDLVDLNGKVFEEGFSKYLVMEIDSE